MLKRRTSALTDQDRTEADEVYRSAFTALTRLRVLASTDVVKCAENVHIADDKAYKLVFNAVDLPNDEDWELHQKTRRELMHAVLNAVRHDLRLGEATKLNPALY